jgi:glycosyltransferase involved in cell wall biosynthesis
MKYSPIPLQEQYLLEKSPRLTQILSEKYLWSVTIDGDFSWVLKVHQAEDASIFSSAKFLLDHLPEEIILYGPVCNIDGSPIRVLRADLFFLLQRGYEYTDNGSAEKSHDTGRSITFVVDTALCSRDVQERVVRTAHELQIRGGVVNIVADYPTPAMRNATCAIDFIVDPIERFCSISSDIVIVNTIDVLPLALQCRQSRYQRVVHFSHSVEEFTVCSTHEQFNAHKPILTLLNSLPVERIVPSVELQGYYRCLYHQECSLIEDVVDCSTVTEENSSRLFNMLGEDDTPIKCVQRVVTNGEVNGVHVLLEALILCAEVFKQQKKFHLSLLLEPGVANVFYSKQLPANVHLDVQRNVSREAIQQAYALSDIYIDSSYVELSGYAALEAMGSSLSVIKADNGSLKLTPRYQESVVECSKGSATNLATAIMCLIENPDVRRDMIVKGRVLVRKFSRESYLMQLTGVFGQLIQLSLKAGIVPQRPASQSVVELVEQPRFSILVPVYNHDSYLGEALDTLRDQTYPHWEAIVVNDGSTDRTSEVMAHYASLDSRFKIYHKQNGGTASALNAALDKATNPWICWLSSDDFFKPKKLEIHAKYILALPHIRFFHSKYSTCEDNLAAETVDTPATHLCSNRMALQSLIFCWWNYVHGNTVAIHRDIFNKVGSFSTQYPNAQDFDMWFRMSLVTQFYLIDEVTCTTRIHSRMGTTQFPQAGFFDSYRSVVDHLNTMRFDQLFPFVDFSIPREIEQVLKETISIACAPNAFIYQGVLQDNSVLLDKVQEWILADPKREYYRQVIAAAIDPVVEHNQKNNINTNLLHFVVQLMSRPQDAFSYRPRDTVGEFLRTYEYGLNNNRADVCVIMGRYLNKLRHHKVRGALDIEVPIG